MFFSGSEVHVDMGDSSDDTAMSSTHGHTHAAPGHPTQEINPLSILLPYLSKFGVFILILLLKILYSHRYGKIPRSIEASALFFCQAAKQNNETEVTHCYDLCNGTTCSCGLPLFLLIYFHQHFSRRLITCRWNITV